MKMKRRRKPSPSLGQVLLDHLPFPEDYSRTDARSYEAYRTSAIATLRREAGLTTVAAHTSVDEAIAFAESRNKNFKKSGE